MNSQGDQFIQSLQDGRSVWLNGTKIDVTTDENFKGTLTTISELFNMMDDSQKRNSVGYLSPKTRGFVHSAF